ncbi:heterokaryon incompatibility protein-domain-containing protein [Fusarium tricinctum]|uniref:Heterokaryon incompatibility protein-domain-containing protein n=1 Tax=Fusarium tricinctum TaxID=61284 RepID=A0A8K0W5Q2_9HYPO|nr:heterokaryon incompatibility protein-domain-containing protein [Fusarium tricinctum]
METQLHNAAIIKYRGSRCIQGAINGCALFQEFIAHLVRELKARGYNEDNSAARIDPERWVCQLYSMDPISFDKLQRVRITWKSSKDQLPLVSPYHPERPRSVYWLTAEEDDPAGETIRARPFSQTPLSEESRQWVMSRVQACETSHNNCQSEGSGFTPSRLLRLVKCPDGSLCVRLQDMPKGGYLLKADRYTALSYCWGGDQELQLNAKTKVTLVNGISVSSLPRTIRDAVLVTQNLRLQFIWVDCLCIHQDNPQDIALQITQMPEIYKNSWITISAARARHNNEGFLHDASLPPISEPAFRLPFACPDGKLGSVILSSGLFRSPIDTRAWTLQEYILSCRVLQFTNAGLHWTCREHVGFRQDDACLALDYLLPFRDSYSMFQGLYETNRACRHWMNIVKEYTKRELTYALDKLPAISGVAQVWAQALSDSYLAGLWLSHLPGALLWRSAQPHRQPQQPAEYLAPTWSWASLIGQVDWFDSTMTTIDPGVMIISGTTALMYPGARYGQVLSGSLVIHGYLQEAVLTEELLCTETLFPVQSKNVSNEVLDLDMATTALDFWDDVLEERTRGCKVYCLRICLLEEDSRRGPSGLILVTKDEKTFRRVGVFEFEPRQVEGVQVHEDYDALFQLYEDVLYVQRSAFCQAKPRTITIV